MTTMTITSTDDEITGLRAATERYEIARLRAAADHCHTLEMLVALDEATQSDIYALIADGELAATGIKGDDLAAAVLAALDLDGGLEDGPAA
jgi:hypothetical protein